MDKHSLSLPKFHQALLHAKNDKELINIMHKYISQIGGFGNAPLELYEKFRH